jgi:hypothetical protein
LESQIHIVADLDQRLGQIDTTIEEAANRGRTNAALSAMEGQRKARAALADQRQREGVALADFKAERAALGAKGKQIGTEAAPIRYAAGLLGVDSEKTIRWLIALMVLCCDPLGHRTHGGGLRKAVIDLGLLPSLDYFDARAVGDRCRATHASTLTTDGTRVLLIFFGISWSGKDDLCSGNWLAVLELTMCVSTQSKRPSLADAGG